MHEVNERFEERSAPEVIEWAVRTFGSRLAATSSFQTQSLPLLHLIARTAPQIQILFLDTGFHFPETLLFRDAVAAELGLTVRVIRAEMGHENFRARFGRLYQTDPDRCCYINKVEPLRHALKDFDAYISGVRRDQTPNRQDLSFVQRDRAGVYKVCPLLNWTSRDVWSYADENDLPAHPLFEQGYLSIGCAPCTRPVNSEADARSGRWSDSDKTECGLHPPSSDERDA